MAFPSILSVTPTDSTPDVGSATTSYALNLPATVNVGDVLIAAIQGGFNVTSVAWDNATAGTWTLVAQIYRTDAFISVYKKIADGTEDGKTLTITLGVAGRPLGMVYRIGGATGNTNAATQSNGFASSFSWPAVTASWGVKDNLMLGLAGMNRDKTSITPSTDYTYGAAMRSGGTSGVDQGQTAYYQQRNLAAASETAGAVTVAPSGASARVFIILEPAASPAPSPITATMAAQGSGSDVAAAAATSRATGTMGVAETGAGTAQGNAGSGSRAAMAATEAGQDTAQGIARAGLGAVVATVESGADTAQGAAQAGAGGALGAIDAGDDTAAATGGASTLAGLLGEETGPDAFEAMAYVGTGGIFVTLAAEETGLDAFAGAANVAAFEPIVSLARSTVRVPARKNTVAVPARLHRVIVPARNHISRPKA